MSRQIPTNITANFAFTATITPTEFTPIDAYTYTFALRGPSTKDFVGVINETKVDFSGVVNTAGTYRYTVFGTDINDVRTLIESGDIKVDADPTAVEEGQDIRGHAQKVLDAIEAVIEKRATKDQESYTIAGRTLARTPIKDLLELRQKYKDEVKSNNRPLPRAVLNVFGVR